jgi:hypothetical protein
MLASQFNLDHRLAELRQVGTDLRGAQAARRATGSTRSCGDALRSFLGWTTVARPAGLASR